MASGETAVPPARLCDAVSDAVSAEAAPLTLPLTEQWREGGGAVPLPSSSASLSIMTNGFPGAIVWPVQLDAARYRTLTVTMAVDAGESCAVAWRGALAGARLSTDAVNAIRVPVNADGAMHDYLFDLESEGGPAWAGSIEALALFPSDLPTKVDVASVTFASAPRTEAPRIQFLARTYEVVDSSAPWRGPFPQGGRLEAHFAAIGAAPVRFRIYPEGRPEYPLIVCAPRPGAGWSDATATLDAPAEALVIEKEAPEGAAGFLGNPVVFLPDAADPEAIPVILISCDTLRADHCSAYGYERETTPRLTAFARESAVQFDCALTPSPNTLYAHASMLTGLYPRHHGVSEYSRIDPKAPLLPEVLRQHGYLAAGFTGHYWWLRHRFGFARGFDLYNCSTDMLRPVEKTLPLAAAWLDAHPVPRFFLFFHLYDIHQKMAFQGYRLPYDPDAPAFRVFSKGMLERDLFSTPERSVFAAADFLNAYRDGRIALTENDHRMLTALYDDCVLLADNAVGRILDDLKARGLFDRALIVVTADHGETLNERGYYNHTDVFEETIHVPLWVHFPGGAHAGARFAPPVTLMDIVPTVLDTLGVADGPQTDGVSLRKQLEGAARPSDKVFLQIGTLRGVRAGGFKLRYDDKGTGQTLYDLNADPGEKISCFETHPERANELSTDAQRFFGETGAAGATPAGAVSMPTAVEQEQLEALGYLH